MLPRQFHVIEFYCSGNLNYFYILAMNVPETCSVLFLLRVLQWFFLAEVLLCGIGWQEGRGGRFCARTPGLPLASLWAWPGLSLPCLVGDLATPALHSATSLSHAVTGCMFAARVGTRELTLVGLQSFLLQHQLCLLGTGSGAGVFAGEALTPNSVICQPSLSTEHLMEMNVF